MHSQNSIREIEYELPVPITRSMEISLLVTRPLNQTRRVLGKYLVQNPPRSASQVIIPQTRTKVGERMPICQLKSRLGPSSGLWGSYEIAINRHFWSCPSLSSHLAEDSAYLRPIALKHNSRLGRI